MTKEEFKSLLVNDIVYSAFLDPNTLELKVLEHTVTEINFLSNEIKVHNRVDYWPSSSFKVSKDEAVYQAITEALESFKIKLSWRNRDLEDIKVDIQHIKEAIFNIESKYSNLIGLS